MMGHYSIRTTQIYAEITNHKVSRDLETLSENTKGKYALPDDGMPSPGVQMRKLQRLEKGVCIK